MGTEEVEKKWSSQGGERKLGGDEDLRLKQRAVNEVVMLPSQPRRRQLVRRDRGCGGHAGGGEGGVVTGEADGA